MRPAIAWSLAFLVAAVALPAGAHKIGVSAGKYTSTSAGLSAELSFARGELLSVAPRLDRDGDGTLAADELREGSAELAPLVEGVTLTRGERCPARLEGQRLHEDDGVVLSLVFSCERDGAGSLDLSQLFARLSPGHRHLAHIVESGAEQPFVLLQGAATLDLAAGGGGASVGSYLVLGVEHILLGFDHLVFLFGLIVIGGRLRSLLAVVTAFTLAHSVTLALAVLGVITPPSRVIEPLIALSIVYIGVENLFFRADLAKRWRVTAAFGLLHGFGFAGALAEVGVPASNVPLALFLFNVGVELGQLLVLALVVPLLVLARRARLLEKRAMAAISILISLLGLAWLIERLVSA